MSDRTPALDNRVVILNGFTDSEIIAIMNIVKSIYADTDTGAFVRFVEAVSEHPEANDFTRKVLRVLVAAKQNEPAYAVATGDLIFAKTTPNSLQTKLADLIEDMSEDHEYLRNNPPPRSGEGGTEPR